MRFLGCNFKKKKIAYIFLRSAICSMLFGLVYRFFSPSFEQFSPVPFSDNETAFIADKTIPPAMSEPPQNSTVLFLNSHVNHTSENGGCNLFVGDWIHDPDGPLYTNNTCYTIEGPQDCLTNGRPDTDYVNWRWNPIGCRLPRFDAIKFLHLMRGKSLAFIGDSIMRNHVQSLLCVVAKAEQAVEVYHDETYKNRKWSFPNHNFTVSLFWTPFLANSVISEDDNGVSSDVVHLHVDKLDTVWTEKYEELDYVIIAGGKWFLKSAIYYENNTAIGCHNCHGKNNITQVGFELAYRKVLNSTMKFITSSKKHNQYLFFRTTTPDHFENGAWNTGGSCTRTRPFKEGEVGLIGVDQSMRKIELEEFASAKALGDKNGLTLELFDTTLLSLLRPDGHPGVYRTFHPYDDFHKNWKIQNDCLHWCLPGPIDTWNELMLEIIFKSYAGLI